MPDLASDNPIATYRARLGAAATSFVLARRFVAADRWTDATTEGGRYLGVFREHEPDLPAVLQHRRILILGEPGAGKSTAAGAIVQHLLTHGDPTETPLRASLRSYRGNLRALLLEHAPAAVLDAGDAKHTYVLDGIDEVPFEVRDALRRELDELLATDARIVLTARQAFYAQHRRSFPDGFASFHLLDFDDTDVREYARYRAVDPDAFLEAAHETECEDLIHNPFLLTAMLDYYQSRRRLGRTRSDNVEYAINQLIHSRPLFHEVQQRRALRMLAVACETAARNQLTDDEALLVLRESMDLGVERARELLDELSQSILLRTAGGVSFQMRSFGEYLAAEELHDKTIDRLKELAFIRDAPIDTWLNTISYLAELNPKVRAYFAHRHPEWLITASPAAFTIDERTALVRQLLRRVNNVETYLVNQELLSIRRLSRLLTPAALSGLHTQIQSPRGHEVGNALVLLAIRHDVSVIPQALQLATEHRDASPLRYSAIVALINAADHSVLDRLLTFADPTDPYYLSVVDAIGSLCTPADFRTVLPLLERTNAGLSAAFYHFRELTTREALVATIEYFTSNPASLNGYQLDSYLKPIVDLIPVHWDDNIAERLGHLLMALEQIQFQRGELAGRVITHLAQCDRDGVAVRVLITALHGAPLQFIDDLIARPLINVTAAQWINEHAPTYARGLALWLPPGPPRDVLAPQTPEMVRAQQEARAQYQAEQQKEGEAAKTTRDQYQMTMRTARDVNAILAACVSLRKEHWPDIEPDQRAWLADEVSTSLVNADLAHSIRWRSDNQWTHPSGLEPLLDLTDYYSLRLANDVPVVLALKSWAYESISNYYRREGFTADAANTIISLLQERENDNITSHVFSFLRTTGYNTPVVQNQLINLALDTTRTTHIRRGAMERLDAQEPALNALQTLTTEREESIRAQAIRDLIMRHHETTTTERLAALTDDELRAGDVPPPNDSPLDWIANVTAPFAIGELITLRRRALELALSRSASLITAAIAKGDKNRAAAIITRQLSDTPSAWRQHLVEEAEKLRRAARIEAAQQTPFDAVIKKLKGATSMVRIKVWCEGPTDRPVFEKLFTELGETEIAERIDYVAGWPMLVSENKPERWYDGCREAIIIMDGDRGRKLHHPNRPLSNEAKDVEKRFKSHPLTLHVLQRYGIENYFPRHAVETVLGRDLSAYFPVPPAKKIEKHFRHPWWRRLLNWLGGRKTTTFFAKALNEQIAKQLTMADIQGTDLADVLDAVKKVAEQAREY